MWKNTFGSFSDSIRQRHGDFMSKYNVLWAWINENGTEGMCIGMCLGTAIGIAIGNNIGIGISLGMLIGLAIGTSIKKEV